MAKDIQLKVVSTQALQRLKDDKRLAEDRLRTVENKGGVITEGQRAAGRRVGDQIRYSPALMPWMRTYAEWLTLECIEPPKISQRTARARSFARAPVNMDHLKQLESRPDFVAYVRDLESGPLERARNRFQSAYPEYVEAHREALDLARDARDYNAIARIAEPVLDRVIPKKAELAAAASVTVVLAPEQVRAIATYEAPPMLVEATPAEVIPE